MSYEERIADPRPHPLLYVENRRRAPREGLRKLLLENCVAWLEVLAFLLGELKYAHSASPQQRPLVGADSRTGLTRTGGQQIEIELDFVKTTYCLVGNRDPYLLVVFLGKSVDDSSSSWEFILQRV